jgi:hypothetical protein
LIQSYISVLRCSAKTLNLPLSPEKLALYTQIDKVISELRETILFNKAVITMHRNSNSVDNCGRVGV